MENDGGHGQVNLKDDMEPGAARISIGTVLDSRRRPKDRQHWLSFSRRTLNLNLNLRRDHVHKQDAESPHRYVSHMTACNPKSAASASMLNTMVIVKVSGCPLAVVVVASGCPLAVVRF